MKYNVGSLSHEEAMNQFQLVLAYKYSMTSYSGSDTEGEENETSKRKTKSVQPEQ